MIPDIDAFEERAAIVEFDGRLPRWVAEERAARAQGFADANAYWKWLTDYAVNRRLP